MKYALAVIAGLYALLLALACFALLVGLFTGHILSLIVGAAALIAAVVLAFTLPASRPFHLKRGPA